MVEVKKKILELVQQGKISTEEALKLLEELDQAEKVKAEKEKEVVTSLSTVVIDAGEKTEETAHKKTHSLKEKLFDAVHTVLDKVKELDLDFKLGQSVEVSHIFQHGDASFEDIDIDIANGKLELIPWDQSDVRVECQAKVYRTNEVNEARKLLLEGTTFTIENNRLELNTKQKWMKFDAKVFVPIQEYNKVRIRLFNGAISAGNLKVQSLNAKTANGKILISNAAAELGEFETANGNIELSSGSFKKLEVETINGAISAEGTSVYADLQTFNGNIKLKLHNKAAQSIVAKAVTGSVDLLIPNEAAVEGELKSNLGGFNLDLSGIQIVEEKNEVAQKTLKFKMIESAFHKLQIVADTKTGSITVKRNNE
ncbi:DUF4097 family beta strand repeat-containing protein [Peribacillus alkalitolerans]|uniref:DUF4097 family beta strand repeat-containing protein n=1 Tax=Peribacillus alkalitolerans TaxID=1550385 RepID=UPI0013CF64CD|nr:DUF4097 domain-containing protein [Peribacillus alkalitolerans]